MTATLATVLAAAIGDTVRTVTTGVTTSTIIAAGVSRWWVAVGMLVGALLMIFAGYVMASERAVPTWHRVFALMNALPSTNFKLIVGTLMAVATGGFLGVAGIMRLAVDDDVLSTWLVFLAAYIGLGVLQFASKRATAWKPATTASETNTAEPMTPKTSSPATAPAARSPSAATHATGVRLYTAADVVAVSGGARAGDNERDED